MRETATHVFFLRGPFSQWHQGDFAARLERGGETLMFNCAEQYMMASKAVLFGDADALARIMAVRADGGPFHRVPHAQKRLGQRVRGFDQAHWDAEGKRAVFRGNWAKFTGDPALGARLLATGRKHIVEGSATDRVWGVGVAWDDKAIEDPANWRGTNWLGEVLMAVRARLAAGADGFDSWHLP